MSKNYSGRPTNKSHNGSNRRGGAVLMAQSKKSAPNVKISNTDRRDPEISFENFTYPIRFNKEAVMSILNELPTKAYDNCFVQKKKTISPMNKDSCAKALRELYLSTDSEELKSEIQSAIFDTVDAMKRLLDAHLSEIPSVIAKRLKLVKAHKDLVIEFSVRELGNQILQRGKFITVSSK